MQLTKGAIGNLINRYKAVLKKCHLMNTFGSLAVAGMLVMGGAGVAGAADDVALEGKNTYDSAETPTVNHLMGGWLVNTPETAGNAKGDITLTVNGGTISEIIGGSYAQGLTAENNELLTVTHGNITTTISGEKTTSAEFVVGGSKVAGGAGAKLKTGKTSLTINGGTFGTQGKTNDYELVMGGNYAKTAGSSNLTATTEGSSVAVNGGTFHASVVGGSVAHNYSGAGITNVFDNGNTSVTITGGTFNSSESSLTDGQGGINLKAAVIGGGLAYGANTSTVLGSSDNPVTSSVTIDGKNTQVNGKVVAGSVVANGGYAALVHGDTLLSMIGGTVNDDLVGGGMVQDAAPLSDEKPNSNLIVTGNAGVMVAGGTAKGEIVGGNYVRGDGSARVKNSTVSITGGTFAPAADSQNKAQYVIGGNKSMAYAGDTAKTLVKKDSGVLVDGDVTIADGAVVGGSMAKAEKDGKATATVEGNSSVTVNNATSLAGVVGGGLAENLGTTSSAATATAGVTTASLTIDGNATVNGIIYKGNDAGNTSPSAAVIGGGLAYSQNGSKATASVKTASTTINGGTINGDVYAGGMADGTGGTANVETANLTIKGGNINGDVYAGGYARNGGTATVAKATVTFDGNSSFAKTVQGNNATNSTLAFTNYNGAFNGLVAGFDQLDVAEGSTLQLATLSTGEAGKDDKAGVFNNKALTLAGAGNVEAEAVNVVADKGLSVKNGTLTVTESLKSAQDGNSTNGINVSDNGVLRAANNLLVKNEGSISIADGLKALYLGQGGTLAVTGLSSISTADMKDYHSVLVAANSTGLIKYENADITISDGDQATPGNLNGSVAEQTGALLTDTTVEYGAPGYTDTTTINGNYGAETVLISNAADGDHTVNLNGDLTLLGDGKNLITVKGEGTPKLSTVNVSGGKALNLGSAAAPSQGGTLGEAHIMLGNGSSLNAVAGNYTVGAVTGAGGVVSSSAGGSLVVDAIGDIHNVGAVKASQGSIHSKDNIHTDTLTIEGGAVSSGSDIYVAQTVKDMNGTLTATGDINLHEGAANAQGQIVTDGDLILGGDITKAADGQLTLLAQQGTIEAANISATNVAAKKLAASGAVAVDGGTLNLTGTGTATADASTVDSLTLTNGTQADIAGSLQLAINKTLTVGTGDDTVGGTTLSAKHINLNDGMLLVDPAWGLASSNVAVESMGTAPATDDVIVNGRVGVGQNSYLALGTADTGWLPGVVGNYTKGVGLSETGITAALGVFKGIEIADGKALVVNGGLMDTATNTALTNAVTGAAANSATFAANSLLVVNGANIYGDKAAISFATTGTLSVAEGAKLLVTDAVAGQTYTIVGNVNDPTPALAGWKNNGMTSTTDMISLGDAVFTPGTGATTGKVTTSAVRNDAHTVFPNLSDGMANAVNDLYTGHAGAAGQPNWDYADVDSDQMGVRFLSRATDNRFLGADKNAAAESIESAARIAFAGAVPQMTKMASDAGTNAVVNRLGFADPADGAQAMDAEGKIVDRNTTGFALWIAPLWQSQHGWGMDADSMDYGFNGNLGGVSLGADYTFENAIRAGITFNIGGGYAESSGGDLSSTDNRMNFWGLGAYAGWNYENFGVMADVSYTSTWNQLKQDLDSRLGMGNKLEADVQASAISAGLRAEYLLQTSAMDIIPHIGVRYMSLNTWGYDVDTHGGTVLEGDSLHQDIWTFPIGVTFSKDFALDSGWSFKPSLDFTVIPAAGDIKAKHDVHFTGLPGTYEVETQMMDYLTWQGGVGLELANDNMSIGVNYTLQAGQHTTGHGVFGSFRYEF
ncbi:autotransporter domain-containing protein [Desulfovibrio sp.]|uniref:autotransporter domain-containing protein n=1 Tax=Desulfovibrio sp. TaxID=885 RepID=UPI003AAAB3AB